MMLIIIITINHILSLYDLEGVLEKASNLDASGAVIKIHRKSLLTPTKGLVKSNPIRYKILNIK